MTDRPRFLLSDRLVIGDTLWVFAGNLMNQGLGLVSTVLLANTLNPSAFGRLSVALACVWIMAEFTDPGLTVTSIRLGSVYADRSRNDVAHLFRSVLMIRGVLLLVILPIGFVVSRYVVPVLFSDSSGNWLAALIVLGAAGLSLWLYVSSYLQVYQRFCLNALISGSIAALRLCGILALIEWQALSVPGGLTVYVIAPFVGALIGSGFMSALRGGDGRASGIGDLLRFGKWVAVVALSETVFDRLDILMLARFEGAEAVGIYTVAKRTAAGLPLLTSALVTALLPKVARLSDPTVLSVYLKRILRNAIVGIPIIALLLIASGPLLRVLYQAPYHAILPTFRILIITLSLNLLIQPIGLILYAANAPQMRAGIAVIQLVVGFVSYSLLIPRFSVVGAGAGCLLTTCVIGGLTLWTVSRLLSRPPSDISSYKAI